MLIDWFTVGAQALNFLILVWLLKHFLYKPILNVIDARETKIAKELADADAKKAEAQKEHDEFQHKNEEFDQQRAALLTKATNEAKVERQRIVDEARKAADVLSAKRQESLRNDAHNLNQAISRLAQKEVFAITRKALADLATTSLEERMGEVFDRRLRELDDKAKSVLREALKKNSEPALIRSTFDLPAAQQKAIQNALNETFAAEVHVRFETALDLVSGIEFTTNGQKVAWSISDYLTSLEKKVVELLKEQDKPEPKVEPKPEAKVEPKSEVKAATDSKPKPEPKPESQTEATPAPDVESEPKAIAKTEPKAKAKPKLETEAKTGPKSEAKAEPKPEIDVQAKSKTETENKAQPATEPKAELESSLEVQAEPKPEAPGTATSKPEVGSQPPADAKAKLKPEAGPKTDPKSEVEIKPKVEEPEPAPVA
jgi:F-type H+-transporting ATPase subunit b